MNEVTITDVNTFTITVSDSSFYRMSSSAKDVDCLVDGPEHNWYPLSEMYMKCSKCGMSYERPASKDFIL